MVQPKKEEGGLLQRSDSGGTPTGRKRFYVKEVFPPGQYPRDNGHGGLEYCYQSGHSRKVSPYYGTMAEAQYFIDRHDPEPGGALDIVAQSEYKRVSYEWR